MTAHRQFYEVTFMCMYVFLRVNSHTSNCSMTKCLEALCRRGWETGRDGILALGRTRFLIKQELSTQTIQRNVKYTGYFSMREHKVQSGQAKQETKKALVRLE